MKTLSNADSLLLVFRVERTSRGYLGVLAGDGENGLEEGIGRV